MNEKIKNNELIKFKSSSHFNNLIRKLNLTEDNKFIDELFELIKFETHEKNSILFKENQKNNLKLYLILNGKVGICQFVLKKYINEKKLIQIDDMNLGYFLRQLNVGDIFGELALISNENKRTASAYTLEKTKFLVIEKVHFKKKLRIFYKIENELKKQILKKTFQTIPSYFLQIISYKIKKIDFKRGKIILNKNDLIENLYIIIDGVIELFDKIENIKNIDNFKSIKLFNKIIYNKEWSVNQIFGEEIIFYDNPKSKYYFKVKSLNASLYCINYNDWNNFPEIKNYLKNNLNNLLNYRENSKIKKENNWIKKLIQINTCKTKENNLNNSNKLTKFFQKNNKYVNFKYKNKNLVNFNENINLLDKYHNSNLKKNKLKNLSKNKSDNIKQKFVKLNNLSLLKLKFLKKIN